MEIIVSSDNKKIKHISKLKDKSYRGETSQYFAEGQKWVLDALKFGTTSDIIDYILIKKSKIDEFESSFGNFDRVYAAEDGVFDKISDTKNSQGVLAVLNAKKPISLPQSDRLLYLDRVRDPGNMGTVIRTACAAGYCDIVCDNCVDVYNPKVIRSSMSTILHVNVYSAQDVSLEKLKSMGYAVVVADADGESIFNLERLPEKLVLVIGNEAEGVSKEIFDLSDVAVSIPMNKNVESLNAAVSAAVLMYNLKRF